MKVSKSRPASSAGLVTLMALPYGFTPAATAPVHTKRVDLLRGLQGTLYGSDALGGTIKDLLQQPKLGRFEGSAAGLALETGTGR